MMYSLKNLPPDRRLVMQYLSMQCRFPGSGEGVGRLISDQGHPNSFSFMGVFVPMKSVPDPVSGPGHNLSVGGTPAQVLFDAGTLIQIAVDRTNGTDTAFCFTGFTGYLIPVP